MSVKERVKTFVKSQSMTISDFEKSILASNGYVNSISKSIGLDKLNIIIEKYSNLNLSWLITGNGSMLNESTYRIDEKITNTLQEDSDTYDNKIINGSIPLVYQDAVAGFGNSNFSISEQDVKDYYVVPKFKHQKVDFMIEVRGNSMYPKYNSGDVIACGVINEHSFIQWNKPHVIATKEQGILVKRILEDVTNDSLILKSDNKDYPEFKIPKEEVTGIALVVGVIRLE